MKLSKTVSGLKYSPIRKFNPLAKACEDKGMRVYKLNIGQPDIETPGCFMKAIHEFDTKVIAYQSSEGYPDLVSAIIDYTQRDYGITLEAKDLIVTMGASEALTATFSAILEDGDEVLLAEPFYSNYNTFVEVEHGKIVPIPTSPHDGFKYADRELLEKYVSPKTKAIVCINPGNPTGNVLTREEMDLIADFAKEHDLWIISDEAYREYVFDGRKPMTFLEIEQAWDRLITVDSISKRFSACGARIGYVVSKNREFMEGMLKIAQGRLCVPTIDQVGAAALFRMPRSYFEEIRNEYETRRNVCYEEISKIPGVVCTKPGGAFYMSFKIPVDNAEDFLLFLLTEFNDNNETVMFAPASGFYATPGSGMSEIRIAYVLNADDLKRACELIRLGIERYNEKKN